MSDAPGGKLVSVTRPSGSVVPRQRVVVSESAISDVTPLPANSTGAADTGLSGVADTTLPLTGPPANEIRNVALPATTMRVLTVPVPDAITVRASERS